MNVIVANQRYNELSNLDIDVIKSVTGEYSADELVAMFKDFFFDRMILDITAIKGYENEQVLKQIVIGLGESKLILVLTDEVCSSANYLSNIVSMGVYNFTNNINAIKQLIDRPNTYKDVAEIQNFNSNINNNVNTDNLTSNNTKSENTSNYQGIRVLGIKKITEHAGATTLSYMLKKELINQYGNPDSIYVVEVNNRDNSYFNDKNMISVSSAEVERKVRELSYAKLIIVDLNDMRDDSFCDEVLYLIEPSSIMLNKLVKKERSIFERLSGKKIVLNKSLLSNKDITEFEYEANIKVFYNLPPLDERKKNPVIMDLLSRLGISGGTASIRSEGSKIFGIFGKH